MSENWVIQRSTEWGLRAQITEKLVALRALIRDKWPFVKKSVAAEESVTIPSGYQLIIYDEFTVDGEIVIEGELVIL